MDRVITQKFSDAIEEAIAPVVQKFLPYLSASEDKMRSKAQIEKEYTEVLTAKNTRDRFQRGCEAIAGQLPALISPFEYSKILEEWQFSAGKFFGALELFLSADESKKKDFPSIKSMLGISDFTLDCFYKCGCTLYEHNRFQESSDVFYIVSFLDSEKTNSWLGLGLSTKKNDQIDEAIWAFEQAGEVDLQSALPFLYSAECYIERDQFQDAVNALKKAHAIATEFPKNNHPNSLDYIESLIKKYENKA